MRHLATVFVVILVYIALIVGFFVAWATFPVWAIWAILHESKEPQVRPVGGWN